MNGEFFITDMNKPVIKKGAPTLPLIEVLRSLYLRKTLREKDKHAASELIKLHAVELAPLLSTLKPPGFVDYLKMYLPASQQVTTSSAGSAAAAPMPSSNGLTSSPTLFGGAATASTISTTVTTEEVDKKSNKKTL